MLLSFASSTLCFNVGAPGGVVARSAVVQMNAAEDAARAAWLANQDQSWGALSRAPPAAPSTFAAPVAATPASEDGAKAAWLAKQEVPTWGAFVEKGGKALSKIASGDLSGAAAELFGAAAAPSVSMTTEEQAKQAWLAKQDEAFGGYTRPGGTVTVGQVLSEETAKAAWLAKQELPTWGPEANHVAATAAASADPAPWVVDTLSAEEQAKAVWLARQDLP